MPRDHSSTQDDSHRVAQRFELALSSYEESDRKALESKGWQIRHAMDFSRDLDAYRQYIAQSRGEFTVAKDQNIRLKSGWFSDRSACYLTAGRPVITQETGFSNHLPVGRGLFGFLTIEEILAAIETIESRYTRASQAALEIANACFSATIVLQSLLRRANL